MIIQEWIRDRLGGYGWWKLYGVKELKHIVFTEKPSILGMTLTEVVTCLRQIRFEELHLKTIEDHKYGEPYDSFIQHSISNMVHELKKAGESCIDSVRWAKLRKHNEMKRFKKARSCCGSYEEVIIHRGERFIIGCNYGH